MGASMIYWLDFVIPVIIGAVLICYIKYQEVKEKVENESD